MTKTSEERKCPNCLSTAIEDDVCLDCRFDMDKEEAFYALTEEQQEERDEEICLSLCKVMSHGHSMHSPECPKFIEQMDGE